MIKSILEFVHAYLITALTFYIPVVPDVTRFGNVSYRWNAAI